MPEPRGRLKRAAIMAFGATMLAACGDKGNTSVKTPEPDPDAGTPIEYERRHPGGGGNNMPYGAPPRRTKRVV